MIENFKELDDQLRGLFLQSFVVRKHKLSENSSHIFIQMGFFTDQPSKLSDI